MKYLVGFTTLFVLILVFVAPAVLALPIKIVPDNDQPGYSVNERRSIYFSNTVSQMFTAQSDNLTGVGITIGNPNLKNKKGVIFELYEGETLIRTVTISGANIPDGEFVHFVFPAVSDSEGHEFTFRISSPEARDEEVLYVYFTSKIPNWVGELRFGEEVFSEGKLSFVTYHKPESKLQLIESIYNSWVKRMVGFN